MEIFSGNQSDSNSVDLHGNNLSPGVDDCGYR